MGNASTMTKRRGGAFAALFAAFAVAVGGAVSPLTPSAVADEAAASSWSALREAINGAQGERTITLSKDLAYDGTSIEIPAGANITIAGDKTIYRNASATSLDSMFKVKGNLTIGDKVKLSGKTATCSQGEGVAPAVSGPFSEDPAPVSSNTETYWEKHSPTEQFKAVEGKKVMLGFADIDRTTDGDTPGVAYNHGDGTLYMQSESASFKAVDGKLYLKDNLNPDNFIFTVTNVDNDQYQAAYFKTNDGKYIGRPTSGAFDPVRLVNAGDEGYLKVEMEVGTYNYFKFSMGGGDIVTEKYIFPNKDQANPVVIGSRPRANLYGAGKSYLWVGTDVTYWTVEGDSTRYESEQAAKNAAAAAAPKYWKVEGTDEHFASEAAAQEWANQHKSGGEETCTPDDTCAATSWVTNEQFNGDIDNPKGYFINVEEGGKATIKDEATLSNFRTDRTKAKTPKFVAPVAARGEFNIEGKAQIKNNIVGYIVDDGMANNDGQSIKRYVKGAAPNAGRTDNANKTRRGVGAGIDGSEGGSGITGTAGAVIYKGASATGTISGGSIAANRADTGGVMVTDDAQVKISNGTFEKNVGVQFGGGATAENGGLIAMTGGTMTGNVAWFGGGAVFVTENGTDWLLGQKTDFNARKDGNFLLDGGHLDGNTSLTRGGAILVDSDGVTLKSGTMNNNRANVLGGAVYVMGDDPKFSYTVHIDNANITDNYAVSHSNPGSYTAQDAQMQTVLQPVSDTCDAEGASFSGSAKDNTDDSRDFPTQTSSGTGGGVWLCAFGTSLLDVTDNYVTIAGNHATGSNQGFNTAGGTDLHADTGKNGTVIISGITGGTGWKDQNTGEMLDGGNDKVVETGSQLNLINTGSGSASGLEITGNMSRHGGALAADGTFIFGPAQDIARIAPKMDLSKEWSENATPRPITIRVSVAKEGSDATATVADIELDGVADIIDSEFELSGELAPEGNTWRARYDLPVSVVLDGEEVPVFLFEYNGKQYSPTLMSDVAAISDAIADGHGAQIKVVSAEGTKLVFTEIDPETGEATDQYTFVPGEVTLDDVASTVTREEKQRIVPKDGEWGKEHLLWISFANVMLKAPMKNDVKPEAEKYVNKAVHADIVNFDQEFTYDVMAYVPEGATEFTISDTLVDALEFADADGNATTDPLKAISSIVVKNENDHLNSVKDGAVVDTIDVAYQEPVIEGQKLTVTVKKAAPVAKAQGKWVQLTFNARIKDQYRNMDALKSGGWADEAYDKQGSPITVEKPATDAPLVKALNAMIAGDHVIKVIQGPSRLFAYTQNGDYYWTEANDREGTTWTKIESDSDKEFARKRIDGEITDGMTELSVDDPKAAQIVARLAPDKVVRAIEGPSRLFALTENGNYYATPKNDKSGSVWVAPSEGDDFTANAKARFDGTASDNVRELVLAADEIDPSTLPANWPVQSDETHDGIKNAAQYIVKFGNSAESTHLTNTVTVKPDTTQLEIEKSWNQAGNKAWPEGVAVTFGVFAVKDGQESPVYVDGSGKVVAPGTPDAKALEVELNATKTSAVVSELPRLKGTTYVARETKVGDAEVVYGNDAKSAGVVKVNDIVAYIVSIVKKTVDGVDVYVATNSTAEVEKYVNNKVHADLENFNDEFEFSVMGFVPEGATKVTLVDTLIDQLEFVNADPSKVLSTVVVYKDNDHKGDGAGTVSTSSGENVLRTAGRVAKNERADCPVSVDGKTLTLELGEGFLDEVRTTDLANSDDKSFWVKMSFKAKITQAAYEAVAAKIASGDDSTDTGINWEKVTDNGTVIDGDAEHAGELNKASYKVQVGNAGTAEHETNTVTVKPKTVKVEAEKKWKNADGSDASWPADVNEVKVNVLNGADVVDTIVLNAQKPKASSKALPKLAGVTYTLDEVAVPGYVTEKDGNVFTNRKAGEPSIEKYINKDVDAHLVEFDRAFTYDILAFVPANADAIEIDDTLVDSLEFADASGAASTDPAAVVTSIAAKASNNHQANGTVASADGTPVEGAVASIDGKALKVELADATAYRGTWIQVTFNAKYTDAAISAATVADSQTVTDNGTVISEISEHDGTANTASYKIKVGNEWSVDHESNTVTHDAETVKVEAEKQWKNPDGTDAQWPANVASVKVKVINTKTQAQVATITLSASKPKAKSKALPKLVGVTYAIAENPVHGYISRIDGNVVVNTEGEGPEVEKYVNNDVTYDYENFDQTFEYEIMGYVTHDATSATFTDRLNDVLEFVGDNANIKVYAMGSENDHATTVAGAGTEVTSGFVATAAGQDLSVAFDEAGITPLRGQWVKVVFNARISGAGEAAVMEKLAEKAASQASPKTAADGAAWENISDNGTVLIEKTHDGVPNTAGLKMTTANNGDFDLMTNTVTVEPKTIQLKAKKVWKNAFDTEIAWPAGAVVNFDLVKVGWGGERTVVESKTLRKAGTVTFSAQPRLEGYDYEVVESSVTGVNSEQSGQAVVSKNVWTFTNKLKPEQPEIEKYVNKNVHSEISLDEVFTYDVLAYVTKDADKVSVYDELNSDLQFVSAPADVKVVDLGATVDHLPNGSVAGEGTPVAGYDAAIDGQKLTVTLANTEGAANVTPLRGHWIKVTFDAKIADGKSIEDLQYATITDNGPVLSTETHEGVPNTASYKVEVGNDGYPEVESNTVTVKPNKPEIEKYVNKTVHSEISLDEVFTYDVLAWVTNDADKVEIFDTLNSDLQFAGDSSSVELSIVGPSVDHKPYGSVAGEAVAAENYEAAIEGQQLTLTIPDATALRGQWVKMTFKAKIADGKTIEDLQYAQIEKNAPVISDETHEGVPNTASYKITVGNEGKYELESNTVTVKPNKPEIEKYVNKAVHKDVNIAEVFPYDLVAWVTADADTVTIVDELMGDLAFVSSEADVTVEALGAEDNHKVVNKVDGTDAGNADATVAAAGTTVAGTQVNIEGQKLTVYIPDATAVRGQWVRVSFKARIAEGRTIEQVEPNYQEIKADAAGTRAEPNVGNAPVASDEDHTGLPNTTSYTIGVKQVKFDEHGRPVVDGEGKPVTELVEKYSDESNTVTVKPKTHTVVFSKQEFGDDTKELPGAHIVIRDSKGVTVEEWTSTSEPHEMQLVTGEYTFEEVSAPEGFDAITTTVTFTVDENGKVTVTSATENIGGRVSVVDTNHLILEDMPTKYDVYFSKAALGEKTEELEGAVIKVTGPKGFEETWTSTTEAHLLKLEAGEYTFEEVNAPEGFLPITTTVTFTVATDGTVTVTSAAEELGNGGKVSVEDLNHLILEDAPKTAPAIEKYVNKDVHSNIVEFDREFTYDVMAHVSYDAASAEVYDTLVDQLEFADASGAPTTDAAASVLAVQVKDTNDHTANGSVAAAGTPIDFEASIDGQKLTVKVADVAAARGKWIQVTFNARIKDAIRTMDELGQETISDNAPVISEIAEHTGVPNTASYVLFDNEGSALESFTGEGGKVRPLESNTVTVVPETVSVDIDKSWVNAEGWEQTAPAKWPRGAIVTANVMLGEQVVAEVTLDVDHQSAHIEGLPKLKAGDYEVDEVEVEGYFAPAEGTETHIDVDGNVTVKLVNRLVPVRSERFLDFAKVDEEGKPVEGAELELTGTMDFDGSQFPAVAWTTDGSLFRVDNLVPGTYTLTEKKAPSGYLLADPIEFVVDESGNVLIDGVPLVPAEGAAEVAVTMVDRVIPDDVTPSPKPSDSATPAPVKPSGSTAAPKAVTPANGRSATTKALSKTGAAAGLGVVAMVALLGAGALLLRRREA